MALLPTTAPNGTAATFQCEIEKSADSQRVQTCLDLRFSKQNLKIFSKIKVKYLCDQSSFNKNGLKKLIQAVWETCRQQWKQYRFKTGPRPRGQVEFGLEKLFSTVASNFWRKVTENIHGKNKFNSTSEIYDSLVKNHDSKEVKDIINAVGDGHGSGSVNVLAGRQPSLTPAYSTYRLS